MQDTFQNFDQKIFQKLNLTDAQYAVQSRYKVPFNAEKKKLKEYSIPIKMEEGFKHPFNVEDPASIKVNWTFYPLFNLGNIEIFIRSP